MLFSKNIFIILFFLQSCFLNPAYCVKDEDNDSFLARYSQRVRTILTFPLKGCTYKLLDEPDKNQNKAASPPFFVTSIESTFQSGLLTAAFYC
jgi:hypothetical protein